MPTRSLILQKAAELLAGSPTGDIATRAVCEAAGVTQPVLYRLFGDKDGLLAATVDHVWEQYLSMKRAARPSPDPLADLYAGWDSHVAFAQQNPHAYRLLFGTTLTTTPEAAAEAMRLLRANLERLAAEGRLRLTPHEAARVVMAANTGVALALLLRPLDYPDAGISTLVRDTIYRSILVAPPDPETAQPAAFVAATTLRAQLAGGTTGFTEREADLLDEWLERIQSWQPRLSS